MNERRKKEINKKRKGGRRNERKLMKGERRK